MLKNKIKIFNEIIFQNNSKNYSAATAIVVFLIAMIALTGWHFNIESFKHPLPELLAMNPITAVVLIFSATSLLILIKRSEKKSLVNFAIVLAWCTMAVGILKLLFLVTGIDIGMDYWLYKPQILNDLINNKPNRIAPTSAVNFIFLGSSILLIKSGNKKYIYISNFLIALTAFISLLSIIGYTFGAEALLEIRPFIPMAFHTAICFLLLSIGILCAETDKGFMASVTGPYRGGQIIQLLMPMAILIPIVFGLLRLYGERSGLYNNSFGTALFATVNIVVFILLILKTASSLNQSDKILLQEIEERKKIERELKENNIFLDAILQNAPNMIFVKDAKDFRFVQINKDGEKLLGISRNNILGKDDYELFPKDQADYLRKVDRALFENKILLDIPEERLTTKNGDRWLHTKKIPVIDESGTPQYLVGIAEDITDYKLQNSKIQEFYKDLEQKVQQRTEELLKSEQRFKALLENSIDAISLTNSEGTIIYQSPSVKRMTGYSLEDRKNRQLIDYIHPEDHLKTKKLLSDLRLNPGTSVSLLVRFLHKEDYYIWIGGTITDLTEDKSVQGVVYNFRDITEKKWQKKPLPCRKKNTACCFQITHCPPGYLIQRP